MKGSLLSSYQLHPALMLALDAATAQARECQQDYLGVEHLLLGILQTENPDGPGLTSLALLGVTPEMVLEKLMPAASQPTDRRMPRAIPFTPRSLLVLDTAADFARKDRVAQVHAGHLIRAMMEERESLAAWAMAEVCVDSLTVLPPSLPPSHRAFAEWAFTAHGTGWEFPSEGDSEVLRAVALCGRVSPPPPELRLVWQMCAVYRWFASATMSAIYISRNTSPVCAIPKASRSSSKRRELPPAPAPHCCATGTRARNTRFPRR